MQIEIIVAVLGIAIALIYLGVNLKRHGALQLMFLIFSILTLITLAFMVSVQGQAQEHEIDPGDFITWHEALYPNGTTIIYTNQTINQTIIGNAFDQNLNTTDEVSFYRLNTTEANITITNTTNLSVWDFANITSLLVRNLASCDTIDTTANGTLICGTDDSGGGDADSEHDQSLNTTDEVSFYTLNTTFANITDLNVTNNLQVHGNIEVESSNYDFHIVPKAVSNYNAIRWDGTLYLQEGTFAPFTYVGFYTLSDLSFFENKAMRFGATTDSMEIRQKYVAGAEMHGAIGISDNSKFNKAMGRTLVISELDDMATRWYHGTQPNPTVYIQSDDATKVLQFISFTHDQTNAVITAGTGDIRLNASVNMTYNAAVEGNLSVGINTNTSHLLVRDLVSCDTIDTTANGTLICGSDGGGGATDSEHDQTLNTTDEVSFLGLNTTQANITNLNVTNNATIGGNLTVDGNFTVSGEEVILNPLVGAYTNGEAYVCVYDNGTIFAKDSACA